MRVESVFVCYLYYWLFYLLRWRSLSGAFHLLGGQSQSVSTHSIALFGVKGCAADIVGGGV